MRVKRCNSQSHYSNLLTTWPWFRNMITQVSTEKYIMISLQISSVLESLHRMPSWWCHMFVSIQMYPFRHGRITTPGGEARSFCERPSWRRHHVYMEINRTIHMRRDFHCDQMREAMKMETKNYDFDREVYFGSGIKDFSVRN